MTRANSPLLGRKCRIGAMLVRVERWGEYDIPIYRVEYDGEIFEVPQHITRFTQEKNKKGGNGWFIRFERKIPGIFRHFVNDKKFGNDPHQSLTHAAHVLKSFLSKQRTVRLGHPIRDKELDNKRIKTGVSGLLCKWMLRSFSLRPGCDKKVVNSPQLELVVSHHVSRLHPNPRVANYSRGLNVRNVTPDTVFSLMEEVYAKMEEEFTVVKEHTSFDGLEVLKQQSLVKPTVESLIASLEEYITIKDERWLEQLTFDSDLMDVREGSRPMITTAPLWWTTHYVRGTAYRAPSTITPSPDGVWEIDEPLLDGNRFVDEVPFGDDPEAALKEAVSYLLSARISDCTTMIKLNSKET